jgi:hypothetical protein
MRRPPRLFLLGTLAALALLAPASALAQTGGSVQPKIVGGSTADVSTYPWQAAVVYSTAQSPGQNAQRRQFCGGSLLTSRIVITAAHCIADGDPDCSVICSINDPGGDGTAKMDPNDVDVVLGRSTLSDASHGAEYGVTAVVPRANYNGNYQGDGVPRYDVAYLVLASPAGDTPIKIAGTDEGALWDPDSSAEISGWGSTSETDNTVDTLRAATVSVIPDSACASGSVYGSDFDAHAVRRLPERRRGQLLRGQRRAAGGTPRGRRVQAHRHHRLGGRLRPRQLTRGLHQGGRPGDALVDRLGRRQPGSRREHLRQWRSAPERSRARHEYEAGQGAEEVQAAA